MTEVPAVSEKLTKSKSLTKMINAGMRAPGQHAQSHHQFS